MRSYLFSLLILPFVLDGQIPSTSVFVMDMKSNEQKVLLTDLTYLTEFNDSGYNNQPHFRNNDHLLITSNWQSESTDVLELDLRSNEIKRITRTSAGEFSPTTYGSDAQFAVVRQTIDSDENVDQVLWSYPLDQSNSGQALISNPNTIGYFTWLTSEEMALFLVGEPNKLVIYNLESGDSRVLARNIGRCLKTDDKGNLFYTQQVGTTNQIKKYNLTLDRSEVVTNTLPDEQDFDILPNGFLISGQDARLMSFRPLVDSQWQLVKDLSGAGIEQITRIASSQHRIAFVAQ